MLELILAPFWYPFNDVDLIFLLKKLHFVGHILRFFFLFLLNPYHPEGHQKDARRSSNIFYFLFCLKNILT
jgi:hypothetical protein